MKAQIVRDVKSMASQCDGWVLYFFWFGGLGLLAAGADPTTAPNTPTTYTVEREGYEVTRLSITPQLILDPKEIAGYNDDHQGGAVTPSTTTYEYIMAAEVSLEPYHPWTESVVVHYKYGLISQNNEEKEMTLDGTTFTDNLVLSDQQRNSLTFYFTVILKDPLTQELISAVDTEWFQVRPLSSLPGDTVLHPLVPSSVFPTVSLRSPSPPPESSTVSTSSPTTTPVPFVGVYEATGECQTTPECCCGIGMITVVEAEAEAEGEDDGPCEGSVCGVRLAVEGTAEGECFGQTDLDGIFTVQDGVATTNVPGTSIVVAMHRVPGSNGISIINSFLSHCITTASRVPPPTLPPSTPSPTPTDPAPTTPTPPTTTPPPTPTASTSSTSTPPTPTTPPRHTASMAMAASAALGPYPGRSDKGVMGTVWVEASNYSLTVSGTLSGLPPSTTAGFHIHSGVSCDSAGEVGGHWYNVETGLEDPWTPITYASDSAGVAVLNITMTRAELGYNPLDGLYRTVVVHSPPPSPVRVACGVLGVLSEIDVLLPKVLGDYYPDDTCRPTEDCCCSAGRLTVTVREVEDDGGRTITLTSALDGGAACMNVEQLTGECELRADATGLCEVILEGIPNPLQGSVQWSDDLQTLSIENDMYTEECVSSVRRRAFEPAGETAVPQVDSSSSSGLDGTLPFGIGGWQALMIWVGLAVLPLASMSIAQWRF